MDDILKSFLEEGEKILQTQSFDFFPEPSDAQGNKGILPMYYLRWAASRGLVLNGEVLLQAIQLPVDFSGKIREIRNLLGESLLPAHFTEIGNDFSQQYYRPGGGHSYLVDFDKIFPEYDRFEDVPDTDTNFREIELVLDERFGEWKKYFASYTRGLGNRNAR